MTPGERSTLKRAVVVVVTAAVVRLGVDRSRPATDPLSGAADVAAVLDSASAELALEDAARSRPLQPGERLDANRASAVELDRLPGVGPALAARWVAARDSLGGFARSDDLTRIPGIGPATAARLVPLLEFSPSPSMLRPRVRAGRVDLNSADATALVALPGIGPVLAERIVEHRRRAPFRSVDELLNVAGVGPATLRRLRPRVTVRRSKMRLWRSPRRRVNVQNDQYVPNILHVRHGLRGSRALLGPTVAGTNA